MTTFQINQINLFACDLLEVNHVQYPRKHLTNIVSKLTITLSTMHKLNRYVFLMLIMFEVVNALYVPENECDTPRFDMNLK